jgi:hypothetical protein
MSIQSRSNDSKKKGPSASLFAINPTWIHPGTNPDFLEGEKPATIRLSYSTAMKTVTDT